MKACDNNIYLHTKGSKSSPSGITSVVAYFTLVILPDSYSILIHEYDRNAGVIRSDFLAGQIIPLHLMTYPDICLSVTWTTVLTENWLDPFHIDTMPRLT